MTSTTENAVTNLVRNPGFDEELGAAAETTWTLGFVDESKDRWAFDEEVKSTGTRSIRFEPHTQCVATQVVATDLADLEGKTVTVSADIRHDDTTQPPLIMVMAFNDELPLHPVYQTGLAGMTQLSAPKGRDGRFVRYHAKFVATAAAKSLQVTLLANGSGGKVWFDDVNLVISD